MSLKVKKLYPRKAYNQILKYTGLLSGVQGLQVLMSVVRNKVTAVLLGTYGTGLIELYNNALNVVTSATTLIVSMSSVREMSSVFAEGDEKKLRECIQTVRSWGLISGLIGCMVSLLGASVISNWFFGVTSYSINFIYLAPIIFFVAIGGSEMSILKATRHLKSFATAMAIGSITTLLIAISLYLFFGARGIVPALLFSAMVLTFIEMYYSCKYYKYRANPFSWKILRRGKGMIKLSIAYIFAAIIASVAEAQVRSFITTHGGIDMVGLYGVGFVLIIAYARIVFVAMDADYFPRLSMNCNKIREMNFCVNRQIEVLVLLIAPFLIAFSVCLPIIIPLLYSSMFLDVIPMVVAAMFYMFFRAINTPVAYLSLAKGDSVMYFSMETIYYIAFVFLVISGYSNWGLRGAGVMLSFSNFIEMIMITIVYHYRYKFIMEGRVLYLSIIQFLLVLSGLLITDITQPLLRYPVGAAVLLASIIFSCTKLMNKNNNTNNA